MTKLTRLLSLLIVICLIAALCACSEVPEVIPEYGTDKPTADLDGYELTYAYSISNDDVENVLGYIPTTGNADLAAQRITDVEKALNCKINILYVNYGTSYGNMQASIISGSTYCDVITNESYVMVEPARAGYLTGLSTYLDVKNTEKWGTSGMLQSMFWEDDQYAVLPNYWPDLLYGSFGYPICVNEDIVTSFGETDPREYVENNTWNWDQFEATLHALTKTEGDKTIYGFAIHTPYFGEMMFRSNGDALAEYINGEIVCGLYTDTANTALARAQEIYNVTCKDCFYPDSSNTGVSNAFIAGDTVLAAIGSGGILGSSDSIMYKVENVGILPFPQGPNATPGVYPSVHESMRYVTSIPVNAGDPETAATILDQLYEPLPGYETRQEIVDYMMRLVFFDERDVNVFINMLENTEYAFYKEGARTAQEQIVGSSGTGRSVAEVLQSVQSVYDNILAEYMKPHYEGILAITGNE